MVLRDSFLRHNIASDSVAMLSELRAAGGWYAAGMVGDAPPHARAYVALGSALSKLPPDVDMALQRLFRGEHSSIDAERDVGRLLTKLALDFGSAYLGRPTSSPEVLGGLDAAERIIRALAGMEPIEPLSKAGGSGRVLEELLKSLPEFLQWARTAAGDSAADREPPDPRQAMATETTVDWRFAGAQIATTRETIALVSTVRARPLTADERRRLRALAEELTSWAPDTRLAAAEVADRVEPLLRVRLEDELDKAGIWPVRPGVTTAAYWRALARLWERLTGERVPRLCAAEGRHGSIGARPNRLYCDVHRAERQRERVRRARAPSTLVRCQT